ncbi:MAG: hypothetical protein KKF62_18250 [Bacteroidetes bacterium]|nr:hypothetical protein [Bacteroidota bacterium]MBU1115079.1 hypothetical protein [Bacteroidota bacterium]MBU1797181.1 hypothetical protein [Bacteroidota bacterium]
MKKTIKVLLIATQLFSITLFAHTTSKREISKNTEINVLHSMNHEVETVAESAIFNLLLLKNRNPQMDLTAFTNELVKLATEGQTAKIRYKAQLTYWYLTNKDKIGEIDFNHGDDDNRYYEELADKLKSILIASN